MDFIYPRHCLVCSDAIISPGEEYLCEKCSINMPLAPNSELIENNLIENIGGDDLAVFNAYCLFSSNDEKPFVKLIYALKYAGFSNVAYKMGLELGKMLIFQNAPKYDYIVPIPIHTAKKRERGYNQADFIAKAVAEKLDSKFAPDLTFRNKYTRSQTTLSAEQRLENVSTVFQVDDKYDVSSKTILVVDDVLTTGATINSLAEKLLLCGALQVDAATLMKA